MGLQIKWVKEELTPEQKIKKLQRKLAFAILIILLMALGFVIYELKFAEKSIFDKGDKYEEYDPNYISNDSSNIEQAGKKETSNVIEGITSNINITSNAVNEKTSNITSNNKSNNNSNSIINSNSNSSFTKDTEKPTVSKVDVTTTQNKITISNVVCSDNKTESSKLKKEYSINNKSWQTSNEFNNLYSGTSYTIYARVTDEAGNVSNIYSIKASTNHLNIANNVSGNYSNEYLVYNYNNIIYVLYKGQLYRGTSINTTSYSKTFKLQKKDSSLTINSTFQDNTIIVGNKTYRKISDFSANDMYKAIFGGDFVASSNTELQGYYTSEYGYLYFFAYKDNSTIKHKIFAYSNDLKKGEWINVSEMIDKGSYYQAKVYDNDNNIIAYIITSSKKTDSFDLTDNYKNGESKYPAFYDMITMGATKSYGLDINKAIEIISTN